MFVIFFNSFALINYYMTSVMSFFLVLVLGVYVTCTSNVWCELSCKYFLSLMQRHKAHSGAEPSGGQTGTAIQFNYETRAKLNYNKKMWLHSIYI